MRSLALRALGLFALVVALGVMQTPAFAQGQGKPAASSGPPGFSQPGSAARARDASVPIRVLLITGQNNHNWQYTSRVHADTLEATGRFKVDITDDPATFLADPKNIEPYNLFLLDYNAKERWSPEVEKNFEAQVRFGTGVVAIHAANNAFPGWTNFEKIVARVWRDGQSGHDPFGEFELSIPGTNVISAKFPKTVKVTDELYYGLVQVARTSNVASATSKTTGAVEPIVMTGEYGPAKTANIALGHVWVDQPATKVSVTSPFFRILLARVCEWAGGNNNVTLGYEWRDTRAHNQLSQQEAAAGWQLLFDGQTTNGWRGFKKDKFPAEGWSIKGGELVHAAQGGGGDIVTDAEFGDFELTVDWKVAPGANSGIIYRSDESKDYPWQTGPECQILDDERHADGKNKKTSAGSLYDVVPPPVDVVRPAGEWNTAKVICKGTHIEHWLNGFKVVDIDMKSDEYKAAKAASKWKDSADYGSRPSGHIALQDHGDEVRFRNIKIRKLQ